MQDHSLSSACSSSGQALSSPLQNIPEMLFEYYSRKENKILFTYTSEECEEVLGYCPDELMCTGISVFDDIHKRDLRSFYNKVSESVASLSKFTWRGRFFNRSRQEYRWLKITAKPTNLPSGLTKWSGIICDITTVAEIEQELKQARQKAEAEARAKEEFLATISHEIRTPLNGIVGVTDLLLDDAEDSQMEPLKLLKAASNNLVSLVNNILDFSKLNAGEMVVAENKMSLRSMVENLKQIHSFKAGEHHNKLLINIDQDLPAVVLGDEMILTQILSNLLSNANKFTRNGEVEVGIVKLWEDKFSLKARFYVRDTGIGITAGDLENIFTRFRQAGAAVNHQGGTGLGLPICRDLTRLLNSELQVESEPGIGTTFSFSIGIEKLKKIQTANTTHVKPEASQKTRKEPQAVLSSSIGMQAFASLMMSAPDFSSLQPEMQWKPWITPLPDQVPSWS